MECEGADSRGTDDVLVDVIDMPFIVHLDQLFGVVCRPSEIRDWGLAFVRDSAGVVRVVGKW